MAPASSTGKAGLDQTMLDAPRNSASPLSRSVLAPQSWSPPAPDALTATAAVPTPAVDVAAVIAIGVPAESPHSLTSSPTGVENDVRGSRASASTAEVSDQASPAPHNEAVVSRSPSDSPRHIDSGSPPSVQEMGARREPPPALRTMLGIAATDLVPPELPANVPAERTVPAAQKTMIGVATDAAPAAEPPEPPLNIRSQQRTMLGVAVPGIAPTHVPEEASSAPVVSQLQHTALGIMPPAIVPRPKTLIEEPLPPPPVIPRRRGIPALALVGIIAALVIILGGVSAYVAFRKSGALSAVPQLDESGRESLKITCPSCPDGTTLSLGASSASVSGGVATLLLPAPLAIGENALPVKVDRPGAGRDEQVTVHVPVAYRVRTDLATLGARPPTLTVRVETTVGSDVLVDQKPVSIDESGRGVYALDLSKEVEGPGEARAFERTIPFVITPKNGVRQSGQLTARTSVLPLAIDAPGIELITDKTTIPVVGQTKAGSSLTIDGQAVPVDPQGHFALRIEVSALGPRTLEIATSAASRAPRIAKVKVTRVASIQAAAKELEAASPVSYDVFGGDPGANTSKNAVVEGEVVDVRATGGHTVMLVDSKRGCAKGASCLVRLLYGDEDKSVRGDTVRAYGRVLGSVTASGKTIPELGIALLLPIKAKR